MQHGIRVMYERAYGGTPAPISIRRAWTTTRSEVRRWITEWDLVRHDPSYRPNLQIDPIREDVSETPDDLLPTGDDEG